MAVLVTTSSFTDPALEYAASCGIVCIDGTELAAWTASTAPPPLGRTGGGPGSGPPGRKPLKHHLRRPAGPGRRPEPRPPPAAPPRRAGRGPWTSRSVRSTDSAQAMWL
ncbi:restriction endonuclease [Streptomyces zaomyceticus]|uniref:restriction endonuclease n=1 Tax=Streptomyces zaomyceticus TaxID=68286 RepID=UPI00371A8CAD